MGEQWTISRRNFFKVTGLSGASLWLPGCDFDLDIVPSLSAVLTRREDLVSLRFEFANLQLVPNAAGLELVHDGSGIAYIIVHFAPQHFLEQAVDENAVDTFVGPPPLPASVLPPPPVNARIAGPSRLVFKVPANHPPIPYTGAGLLEALSTLELNVAPNATPPDAIRRVVLPPGGITTAPIASRTRSISRTRNQLAAERYLLGTGAASSLTFAEAIDPSPTVLPQVRPRAPTNIETALELPFRMILSPNKHARFAHAATAVQSEKNGRHELWHTRLATRDPETANVTESAHRMRTVRAIWTRDFDFPRPAPFDNLGSKPEQSFNLPPDPGTFGLPSLFPNQRGSIVHLSSNYVDWPNHPSYVPKPINASKLMLSALGGWLDANVNFTLKSPLPLVSWDHQASMGRDYYVKVVTRGRLFPWGHQSLLIQITERKFRWPDTTIGYLWQRNYIEVIEPRRDYPESWRRLPYSSIIFRTLVTPNLNIPFPGGNAANPIQTTPSNRFRFKVQGVDREGGVSNFDVVAAWYPDTGNPLPGDAKLIDAKNIYAGYPTADKTSSFAGQRIAYSRNAKADDSTYETEQVVFDGTIQNQQPPGVDFPTTAIGLPYAPGIAETALNVEAIRHLLGQQAATSFEYYSKYLESGFPADGTDTTHANRGEILFSVKGGGSVGADFSKKSDTSGGFIDPSMSFKGLSRKTQLTSDLGQAAQNKFDPAQYLPDAMLFGVIPFADVLPDGLLKDAPNFVTQALDAVSGFMEDAAALMAMLQKLETDIGAGAPAVLATLRTKLDGVLDEIGELVTLGNSNPDDVDDSALGAVNTLVDDLVGALEGVSTAADGLPAILDSEKEDLKRRVRSVLNLLGPVKDGLKAFATGLDMVKNLTVKFEWRTPLQKDSAGFFVPRTSTPKGGFLLAVEARAKQVGNNPPGVSVIAGIENFKINVFGESAKLVAIPFKRLLFKVESNRKPEVDVVFDGDVGFDDILAFIQTLAKLIPSAGFSDPPALEVDAEGIRASFSVPIPSIAVGVFSIQNMRLGAGFEIPFIGNPLSISFFFCTREEPFILTVMMVGGGGFVNLKLSPKGIMLLEAALEARAQLAVDFGVASGSISIAVGVYFRLEVDVGPPEKQAGELTGYLRFQGKVDVLGLISASITLLLEMTYEFESKKLVGRATLTIEVSVCFFSFSVEVSCERKLAGGNDDPTFMDQFEKLNPGTPVELDPWAEYLSSFVMAAA